MTDANLRRLAQAQGLSTEYYDWDDQIHQASEKTLVACLRAHGFDTTAPDWIEQGLKEVEERPWRRVLPPCMVVERGERAVVDVHVTPGARVDLSLAGEDGFLLAATPVDNTVADRLIDQTWVRRLSFEVPTTVEPGYHKLVLSLDEGQWESRFIVTPAQISPPGAEQRSMWGFMVQLYSVCSENSWGIGDLVDLKELAVWAKTHHGADFVLINPIHCAQVIPPMEPSPYYPATRRYLNPLYVRPEAIEEFQGAPKETSEMVGNLRTRALEEARRAPELARDQVWISKKTALREIFSLPQDPQRRKDFAEFVASEGLELSQFATWCVLSEKYGPCWREWPTSCQNPHGHGALDVITEESNEIEFYMWLQWIASQQASRAHLEATAAGMALGVMADLAVGVNKDGEETWASPDLFAQGVCVGAPPDAYNQAGQDWSQPPWRPDRLQELCYEPLRAMISAMLSHSGALRIDHILGMFRLWWIPEGMTPDQGAYQRYDHKAMIGILALEAHRGNTTVIGEDLGTVEPSVREYLVKRGILGTSVLWFETGDDGSALVPEQWRPLTLASVATHDLPPALGFLAHDHILLAEELGLLTEPGEVALERSMRLCEGVREKLVDLSLLNPGETDPQSTVVGLHRFLARTPAALKCVALADAVGERRTQNQPGTVNEYPNWRIPLADDQGRQLSLEQVMASDRVTAVARAVSGRL